MLVEASPPRPEASPQASSSVRHNEDEPATASSELESSEDSEQSMTDEEPEMEITHDAVKANMFKDRGNQYFKKGDFDEAVNSYTVAIHADLSNPILYANRAMAFLKKADLLRHRSAAGPSSGGGGGSGGDQSTNKIEELYRAADNDCSQALSIDKDFVKAYFRRGQARKALGMLAEALFDFDAVVRLEPGNALAEKEAQTLRSELGGLAEGGSGGGGGGVGFAANTSKRFFTEYQSFPVRPCPAKDDWSGELKRIRIDELNLNDKPTKPKIAEDGDKHSSGAVAAAAATTDVNMAGSSEQQADSDVNMAGPSEKTDTDTDAENMDTSTVTAVTVEVPPPPTSSFEFYADWRNLERHPVERLKYITAIGPQGVRQVFRHSIEPDIMSDIIGLLHDAVVAEKSPSRTDESMGRDHDESATRQQAVLSNAVALLEALADTGRFDTLVLFLDEAEVAKLHKILDGHERVKKLWRLAS